MLETHQLTVGDAVSETAALKRDVQITQLWDPQNSEAWDNREQSKVGGDCVFHRQHWDEAHLGTQLLLQEDNIWVINFKW